MFGNLKMQTPSNSHLLQNKKSIKKRNWVPKMFAPYCIPIYLDTYGKKKKKKCKIKNV